MKPARTVIGRALPDGMFSSIRHDWRTPKKLFQFLDAEFKFRLDACATADSALCFDWFSQEEDALTKDWSSATGAIWMNPPYGRRIGDWVEKASRSARQGATVVCLLPARTDTNWWHDYCLHGEVRFLRGRLCFDEDRRKRAPFPSAIVIFRPVATSPSADTPN